MGKNILLILAAAVCLSVPNIACGPTEPQPVQAPPQQPAAAQPTPGAPTPETPPAPAAAQPEQTLSKEQLLEKWLKVAKNAAPDAASISEASTLAAQIAVADRTAYAPMLDILADPASTPAAKVASTVSLKFFVQPSMIVRLRELSKTGQEATTRACATELLGAIPGQETDALLDQLKTDPERRVRFTALKAIASRNPEGRKDLQEYWKLPDVTKREKAAIVQTLAVGPISDSLGIFQEAILDTEIEESVRLQAAQLLAQVGDKSMLDALNQCAEKDPSEQVRAAAKAGVDAISARKEPVSGLGISLQ